MIARADMIAQLRSLDPRIDAAAGKLDPAETFNPAAYRSKRKESEFYKLVSDWTIDELATGRLVRQQGLFDWIEDWFVNGDFYVQGVARNKLMVPLIEATYERRISAAFFYPLMGHQTRTEWTEYALLHYARETNLLLCF